MHWYPHIPLYIPKTFSQNAPKTLFSQNKQLLCWWWQFRHLVNIMTDMTDLSVAAIMFSLWDVVWYMKYNGCKTQELGAAGNNSWKLDFFSSVMVNYSDTLCPQLHAEKEKFGGFLWRVFPSKPWHKPTYLYNLNVTHLCDLNDLHFNPVHIPGLAFWVRNLERRTCEEMQ